MDSCCSTPPSKSAPPGYRRVLWVALIVNAAMFLVEAVAGLSAGSASLQADALDFFSDAANYGISLSVLSLAFIWQTRAALIKGLSMGAFGTWVIAASAINIVGGEMPHAATMGVVGFVALLANVGVAVLLFRYRDGDANMRSVWLCSRNDAIGNAAVMLAALGVFGTGTLWPDIAVAAVMASLALGAAADTVKRALAELRMNMPLSDDAHAHQEH